MIGMSFPGCRSISREPYASLVSFTRKDGKDQAKVDSAKDDDPGNPAEDFHGEPRKTRRSSTDPGSVLYRKGRGKESKLCFGGAHVLMENHPAKDFFHALAQSLVCSVPGAALRRPVQTGHVDLVFAGGMGRDSALAAAAHEELAVVLSAPIVFTFASCNGLLRLPAQRRPPVPFGRWDSAP